MSSTTCETSGRQRRKQIDVAQLETRHQVPRLFDRQFGLSTRNVRKRSGPHEGGPLCVRIAMLDSANQVVVRDRAAQHEEHEQQRADRVQRTHSERQKQGDEHER